MLFRSLKIEEGRGDEIIRKISPEQVKKSHLTPGLINVNTDLKLSEITGLKMYFFTGLNAVLYVVPCNPSCDMIYQKF